MVDMQVDNSVIEHCTREKVKEVARYFFLM